MLHIILIILSGVVAGYLLRRFPQVRHTPKLINLIIMLLLFFLGVSVGANEQVVANFSTIGMDALLLTVGGTAGTVLCAWLLYEKLFKRKGKKP